MSRSILQFFGQELCNATRRSRPNLPPKPQALNIQNPSLPRSCRTFSGYANLRRHAPKFARPLPPNQAKYRSFRALAAGGGLLTAIFSIAQTAPRSPNEVLVDGSGVYDESSSGGSNGGLPSYRLSEVKTHGPKSARPWIVYEDKIYDITDWIPAHPGGEVILRAAGGSIEPYWNIFSIHKTPYVREILEQYVIGRVHSDDLIDARPRLDAIEDPFVADPKRDDRLLQLTSKPYNAETAGDDLASDFLTPNEVFYVRNHMWVPIIEDPTGDAHTISIELPDGDVKTYTVGDLKVKFKQYTITSVLQCSGNRRKDMTEYARKTNGLQWGVGAISCARWEGVRLRDVLVDAGLAADNLPEDAQHVQFSALEAYGASIPIHAALDPRGDVLLAFKMNDMPLPPDHGFPVRVVVPGTVAARCVKWLNKIAISDEESHTSWQRRDYKCFGPNETQNLDWDKYKSIQEMPVTSAITKARFKSAFGKSPVVSTASRADETGRNGDVVELEGYAYSGGGREIQRVDVSLDGGKTWGQATFLDDTHQEVGSKKWSWKRWTYHDTLPIIKDPQAKTTTFMVKATDEAYNTQPQCYKSIYNLRGNLATAWHRLEVDTDSGIRRNKETQAKSILS
ncbi:oxidoreductase molybdopterin binding domain-containing protein [Seiridium cupressi]